MNIMAKKSTEAKGLDAFYWLLCRRYIRLYKTGFLGLRIEKPIHVFARSIC